jgi:hypothetical protein
MLYRVAAICLTLACLPAQGGQEPPPPPTRPDAAQVRTQLPRLLAELDSPRFDVRERAAGQFEAWLGRSELAGVLAEEFARRLVDPQLSFEVRWRLERWSKRLPTLRRPTGEASDEELARLIGQLDDDSYAVREGAARRVQWLAGNPRLVGALLVRLKARLADPAISEEARQRLDPLAREIRGAWLTSDPAQWRLPPVSDEQIRVWTEELLRPADGPRSAVRWSAAQQELLDTLARDEYVPRVSAILRQRMAATNDPEAAARLDAVLDWTRPAMVAEYWQARRHLGEQHLTVGEPSQAEGAARPSHFDRIDDRVAHCVSGNTLAPGDYPTGIAFLHPLREDAFFHLVNLPSPRRRLAYSYEVKRDEATRLADITRRTVERFEVDHRVLSEAEWKVLENLDLKLVSGFAGRYLAAAKPRQVQSAWPSVEALAELLAEQGTVEAAPGLTKAVEVADADRWPLALRRGLWLAGLAIAARTPWEQSDAWLAGLVERKELVDEQTGAQVGATAAALLLARHREPLGRFGLLPVGALVDATTSGRPRELQGYRYAASDSPAETVRWWKQRAARGSTPHPAPRPAERPAPTSSSRG